MCVGAIVSLNVFVGIVSLNVFMHRLWVYLFIVLYFRKVTPVLQIIKLASIKNRNGSNSYQIASVCFKNTRNERLYKKNQISESIDLSKVHTSEVDK